MVKIKTNREKMLLRNLFWIHVKILKKILLASFISIFKI